MHLKDSISGTPKQQGSVLQELQSFNMFKENSNLEINRKLYAHQRHFKMCYHFRSCESRKLSKGLSMETARGRIGI